MSDDDHAHRARLRKEYQRRLRVLELRIARQGDGADPVVVTEAEDLQAKIADLGLADARPVAPEIKAAIRRRFDDDLDFLIASFRGINGRVTASEERIGALESVVHREAEQRPRRQAVLNLWLAAISLAVVVNIALTWWFVHRLFGI